MCFFWNIVFEMDFLLSGTYNKGILCKQELFMQHKSNFRSAPFLSALIMHPFLASWLFLSTVQSKRPI